MATDEGQPLPRPEPPPISLAPDLDRFIMHAFMNLHTCRQIGMAEGPIPWTAIDLYAERWKLRGPARLMFEVTIATMDRAYLAEERAKAPGEGVTHAR